MPSGMCTTHKNHIISDILRANIVHWLCVSYPNKKVSLNTIADPKLLHSLYQHIEIPL